jgi:hypothetical protein
MEVVLESRLRSHLRGAIDQSVLDSAFARRAKRILGQIHPHVKGPRVADVGCGDGLIGQELSREGFAVSLVDVMHYLHPSVRLPLVLYDGAGLLPSDVRPVNTALLLTVLHHTEAPLSLFEAVSERTIDRVIIIESVCGLKRAGVGTSPLYGLSAVGQRKYATFVDWFYNRVLHEAVPVPYNFGSPEEWRLAFQTRGWRVGVEIDLGIDQPLVPEHHALFVLDR